MMISEEEKTAAHWLKETQKGYIRIAVLILLSKKPYHGYEIMREIKERTGGLLEADGWRHLSHTSKLGKVWVRRGRMGCSKKEKTKNIQGHGDGRVGSSASSWQRKSDR
jgi:hypothetical protein